MSAIHNFPLRRGGPIAPKPDDPQPPHCPECKAPWPFPLGVISNVVQMPVKVGERNVPTTMLRTLSACVKCGCIISIQFVPFEIELPPGTAPLIA